jgi:hypothetical protein
MHEATRDGAGSGVQVFVVAPDREVGARVVNRERHVADRVREVEADTAAVALCGRRVRSEVEPFAGEILHAGQQHERDALAVLREQRFVARAVELEAALTEADLEQRNARIEPVPAQLRLDGVAVRRERVALDENLEPLRRGPEELASMRAGSRSACSSRRPRRAQRRRDRRAAA